MTNPNGQIPAEVLPDDVQQALLDFGGLYMQVEIYPSHEFVVLRFRRKLAINTDIVILPFSLIDALYKSRLDVLIAKESAKGGVVVPATSTTPAPNSGHLQ